MIDEQTLKLRWQVYEDHGRNITAAAQKLGLARSTLSESIHEAVARGYGTSAYPLPDGLSVKGVSTLYGADGSVRGQWVKTTKVPLEETLARIEDAVKGFDKKAVQAKVAEFKAAHGRVLAVYPVADLHFGMYAWKEEAGVDYDTTIASRTLLNHMIGVSQRMPKGGLGLLLNLGDWFHADNDEQKTRRSGNKLDVDTRWAKVLREGVQTAMQSITLLLERHENVLVKNIPGNHDPYGSLALTVALAAHYANHKRVVVDTEAAPIWTHLFGETLVVAAHGDMVKPTDIGATVAAKWPKQWGNAVYRYAYMGHIHQRKVFEKGGLEVEVFRTLAPKDAWGAQMGHEARRSLVGIVLDPKRGEIERITSNVEEV